MPHANFVFSINMLFRVMYILFQNILYYIQCFKFVNQLHILSLTSKPVPFGHSIKCALQFRNDPRFPLFKRWHM